MPIMKSICQTALVFIMLFVALNSARAEAGKENESLADKAAGVAEKVGGVIEKGAKAAAHGIDHGARAAAHGVEHGVKAAAHGVERGAKATADAAHTVAEKVGGASESASPSPDKNPAK